MQIHILWAGSSTCSDSRKLQSIWTANRKNDGHGRDRHQDARPRQHPVKSIGKEDGEEGNYVGPVPRTETVSAPPHRVFGKDDQIRNQGHYQNTNQWLSGKPTSHRRHNQSEERQGDPGAIDEQSSIWAYERSK